MGGVSGQQREGVGQAFGRQPQPRRLRPLPTTGTLQRTPIGMRALYDLALLYDFTIERCGDLEPNTWQFWDHVGQRMMLIAADVAQSAIPSMHRQIRRHFLSDQSPRALAGAR